MSRPSTERPLHDRSVVDDFNHKGTNDDGIWANPGPSANAKTTARGNSDCPPCPPVAGSATPNQNDAESAVHIPAIPLHLPGVEIPWENQAEYNSQLSTPSGCPTIASIGGVGWESWPLTMFAFEADFNSDTHLDIQIFVDADSML